MSLASTIRDWIEFIAAIAGVAGLLWAVFTYLCDIRATQRKEDPGSICCDEEKMGYFVVKKPAWWKPWKPWARVEVPKLPTIVGLLKAGEAGVWSSELAEGMVAIDNAASWRPLYEAFFRNLTQYDDRMIVPEAAHYLKKVEFWKRYLPNNITSSVHQAERRHAQRLALYKTKTADPATLVSCMRPLDYIGNSDVRDTDDPLQGPDSIWVSDMQDIWIHNSKPCIKVSKEELAALAVSLGIVLEWHDTTRTEFHGVGAFGISLNGRHDGQVFSLQLKKAGVARTRDPTMGSGYSVLFAKHMACGFLPFAQTTEWTRTIRVTATILEALRRGDDIADPKVRPEKSTSLSFLLGLPRRKPVDVYDAVHAAADTSTSTFGKILNSSFQLLDSENPKRWTWPSAVAGIAFGGLVPLATRNLVEVVRYTAQGVDTVGSHGDEAYFPEQLERMVNWAHQHTSAHHLFGTQGVPSRIAAAVGVDHFSNLPTNFGVSTVATMFSRYAVLLERLLALAAANARSNGVVEDVTSRLRSLLTDTHNSIIRVKNRDRRSEGWQEPESKHLGKSCMALVSRWGNNGSNFTVDDCVDVARLIIVSWTYLVNLVSWEGEAEAEGPFETLSPSAVEFMGIKEVNHDLALG